MEREIKSGNQQKEQIDMIFHDMHDHGVKIAENWINEVERRGRGEVRFTSYQGGGPQITRQADVVRDVPVRGGRYHLLDLIQIPLIFPNAMVGSRVVSQLYSEFSELQRELGDVKVAGLSTGALMAVFSSQKWGPIHTLEDLRGARIRSLLPIDRFMEALGAKPVHVDYLDIAPQLGSGDLDAAVLGMLPGKAFKLAENGAPYCTIAGELSITMHPMRIYFKWDSWNKLPENVREVIDLLGPAGPDCWVARQSGVESDSVLKDAMEYFQEKGEIIRLSASEQTRWSEAMRPRRRAAVDYVENLGLPGKKFFNRMLELTGQMSGYW